MVETVGVDDVWQVLLKTATGAVVVVGVTTGELVTAGAREVLSAAARFRTALELLTASLANWAARRVLYR